MGRGGAALGALVLLVAGVAGCGGEEGVENGAVVTAYAERPACAPRSARVGDGEGSGYGVRFVCLPAARGAGSGQGVGDGPVDLARAGANARRATEDSTAVAYLQPDDPAVNRFTKPILESAGIGRITDDSAAAARARLLALLAAADSPSLRDDVREALGQ